MKRTFQAVKISEHVYWVGAVDWAIQDFHGYLTQRGTTYNAYLVIGEKISLIDTVKTPFIDEMLSRISSVVEPGDIDFIISNHSEMDHSGGLPSVIELVKPDKVFASKNGLKNLTEQFHTDMDIEAVDDGENRTLGGLNFTFLETRMLHWPDSMFSYLADDELLFSQDAFGMHLAAGERFADEIDETILEYESKKYFANILLPYSKLVTKLIDKVESLDIDLKAVRFSLKDFHRQIMLKYSDEYPLAEVLYGD